MLAGAKARVMPRGRSEAAMTSARSPQSGVDVDMHVNEARRDDRPANIDLAFRREVLRCGTDDATVAYCHVSDSGVIVCRIDDATAP